MTEVNNERACMSSTIALLRGCFNSYCKCQYLNNISSIETTAEMQGNDARVCMWIEGGHDLTDNSHKAWKSHLVCEMDFHDQAAICNFSGFSVFGF